MIDRMRGVWEWQLKYLSVKMSLGIINPIRYIRASSQINSLLHPELCAPLTLDKLKLIEKILFNAEQIRSPIQFKKESQ
jgi:hypothetical protein